MSRPSPSDESPSPLQRRVEECLAAAGVVRARLVVAVSGGADSYALLRLLLELRSELQLDLIAAHLDHALRPDSADDAAWLAMQCAECDVPLLAERLADATAAAITSEAAARDVRRDFLARVCRSRGAGWVATGHTADDQAETVLHRLLRGTGPRGLGGMAVVAPLQPGLQIIRPLLDVRRGELEAWLRSRSLDWRTDITNADPRFTRNRIRGDLLPLLREQFNPQIDVALVRCARQCRELDDWLRKTAAAALTDAVEERRADVVRLSVEKLAALPRLVQREVFVCLWREQGWPEQRMTFEHWERLADLLADEYPRARLQLPTGLDATRDGPLLRLLVNP